MWSSLAIVLPIFGLIAVGYGARWSGLMGDRTGDGLSEFVFILSVPCLIFRTMARADMPAVQPWGYWIAYFTAVAVVWVLGAVAARRLFRVTPVEAVVVGFASGQANTVFVGVPMILKVYGEAGAVPLFLLIAIHLPVMLLVATVLVEKGQTSGLRILRRLVGQPIVLAIALGALSRPVAAQLPDPLWRMIDLLAEAAVPCSLVAMGVALRRHGLEAGWRLAAVISGLKLIVHPFLVYLLATRVFHMPPVWSGVAVLFAACPCGINAYLLAQHYKEGIGIASSAVALSTAFALVTAIVWLRVLGAA